MGGASHATTMGRWGQPQDASWPLGAAASGGGGGGGGGGATEGEEGRGQNKRAKKIVGRDFHPFTTSPVIIGTKVPA